ncbi:MAG: 2-amino-4-hydroxy-6-hydroxymethyldihydropteridine diphosphokinase [Verrucomicrobiota bacterium]|jgi:2-amino-4-hydroxy-6-hydroxymethyldihydropteridine diphosphokinase
MIPELVILAYGSNLAAPCGSREANIAEAMRLLGEGGFRIDQISAPLASAPVDCPSGSGDFLNGVCSGFWEGSPRQLMELCQEIESRLGRVTRSEREINAPRPIDLDIILFGDLVLNEPDLVIPHPRAHQRDFVMLPLQSLGLSGLNHEWTRMNTNFSEP